MNRNAEYKYCVIKFRKLPFKGIDDFVCIPSSWIRRRTTDKKVLVAYPVEHSKYTEKRVKQRQRLSKDWRGYAADVIYGTDSYEHAQNFIKEQIVLGHNKYNSLNAETNGGPQLSGKKKAQKSKREDKLNHKMTTPEEFFVMKNYESATKIRLKRLALSKAKKPLKIQSNVATSDLIESTESDSEVECSSNEESESSNKNQLFSLYEEFLIEKKQSLDPITITKKEFFPGFSKFLRDVGCRSFDDVNQLITSLIPNPDKTKEASKRQTTNNNIVTASTSKGITAKVKKISASTRNIEKKQNDDNDSNDEFTSKAITAEVTKIYGSTRNAEMEQNNEDDGNEVDQVLNKNSCHKHKFILPPEYDESNSRWTLKYHKSAPGLVELMPHTGVYVDAVKLNICLDFAKDCNTLARILMPEIFKTSALSTCTWTGKRAKGHDTFGVRPGLNKKARTVLMIFVKQYGRKQGWQTDTQPILNNIRNKLRDMRRKQK